MVLELVIGLLRLGRDVALASGDINIQKIKLNRLIVHEARLSAALAGRGSGASVTPLDQLFPKRP